AIVARERDGDAVLEQLGHPSYAFRIGGEVYRIRDGEIIVTLVYDQRNAIGDLMLKEVGDLRVRILCGLGREVGEVVATLVVVDVEMLRLNEIPVLGVVLDLVLSVAEVLRCGINRLRD